MANLLSTIITGGSGTTPTLALDRNIATPSNYYNGLQLEVRATSGTAGIALHRNGYSHVGIYHDSSNELKFNMNAGTPILPATAGTIWGSGNDGTGSGLDADMVDGYHVQVSAGANTIPTRNSSGYLIPENWIQLNGIYGLYSPTNNAHLRPNPNSYGSWLVTGGRNGWGGIEFDYGNAGNISLMISGNSNESGFHNNSYGWQILWSAGTLYVGKGTYGGTNATVWDSSNAPRANYGNLMYYQGFTLNANTMDSNSTGFTYANNAPFYGPIARFSTGGGYDLWLGGSYNGGGNAFYLRTRDGDSATLNPWREIITSGNIGSQSVSYATTAGTATSAGSASVATSAGSVDGLTINNSGNPINPDNVTQNQIGYNTSVSLYGQTDGGLYSSAYSSSWIHQIYGDFRTGQIAIRGKNAGTWQDWRYVLDDKNIGSYAVPYGNMTSSTGLNDNKLYLRTNGDNNHYLWNAADDWEELVYYTGTGFRVKGSTGTVSAAFTDSGISIGTSSTLIRSFDAQGYLRIYGSSTNFLGIGPYNNNGWAYFENSGNGNGIYFNSAGRYAFDSVDVTPYTDAENSLGNGSYRWSNVYTSGWLRQYGAQGMYNQDYGTHFYSSTGSAWNITGSGGTIELRFRSNHESTIRGYVYADTSNQIGFLNNGGGWALRTNSSNNAFIHGTDLTINADNSGSSNIYMNDGDEGMRQIHCNSNRIGFLTQGGSWGSWCNDDGSFGTDYAMYSPIYYDANDTAFYVDPNSASRVRNLYVGDSGSNWSDPGGWGTQFHVSNGPHSIIRVYARNEGIETGMFSHIGGQSKVGSFTNHDFSIVRNFNDRMIFYSGYTYANGYLQAADSLRAPIFYDSNDTTYYLDPNADLSLKVYGEICNSNYQPGRLQPGALNIGRTDTNYAWDGTSWADDIRLGILANTNETWEMAIHDSGDSVMSVVHYDGGNTLSFGRNLSWGNCYVNAQAGYISNSNPWGTNNSAFFPNGITTAGGTNWIYGFTYIGNAPGNGNGHEFNANGTQYSTTSITTPTFIVNSHSDNTRGYRIHNTSGTAVSAMFVNSSNQLVFAAGAVDQINLNKKVYVNGVALGVNVSPSATAGRIDASNDIVAYSSSDERLKYNITPIENALDKVKSLTGVEFDWKPEYKHAHGYEGHDTGIIAQQVQEVIPSAVRTNDTGFLAVRYEKLIGLLIEANKELAARVEELEKKLG